MSREDDIYSQLISTDFSARSGRDMKLVHDACSMETAIMLISELPGTEIRIPAPKNLRAFVERLVRSGAYDLKELSLKLGCSERHLQAIQSMQRST